MGESCGKVFDYCASGLGSVLDLYRRRDHVDRFFDPSSQQKRRAPYDADGLLMRPAVNLKNGLATLVATGASSPYPL
jgi:hypothetical protein